MGSRAPVSCKSWAPARPAPAQPLHPRPPPNVCTSIKAAGLAPEEGGAGRPGPPQRAPPRGGCPAAGDAPRLPRTGSSSLFSARGSRSRASLERPRGLICPSSRRARLPPLPGTIALCWTLGRAALDSPQSCGSRASDASTLHSGSFQCTSRHTSLATELQAASRTPRIVDQAAPASGVPSALTIWKRKLRVQRGKWTEISNSKKTPSRKRRT
ncbi:uncharacterized protein LOC144582244 [Callithrix jacchus]